MARFVFVTLTLLLHGVRGLAPNYNTDRVLASQEVREGVPPATIEEMAASANVARVMRVFPSASWDALFPNANKDAGPHGTPYNYFNFISAAWKFPFFCGEPGQTDAECLHELVVMFSHVIQETGGKRGPAEGVEDGLYWEREIDCYNPSSPHEVGSCGKRYCQETPAQWSVYPCGDRAYYGRGAKQLSWNYNYAFFSKIMTGSADTYLLEPDRIITDGWPALASAIWFWMTPQMPKPSMHEVVTGLWVPNEVDAAANIIASFGVTTNIINGAQECVGQSSEHDWSKSRIGYYRNLCARFSADCFSTPDTCHTMQNFASEGTAGSGPLYYLDKRYDGGEGCQPVAYQMPFLANLDEQECKCYFFPNIAECAATTTASDSITTAAATPTATTATATATATSATTTAGVTTTTITSSAAATPTATTTTATATATSATTTAGVTTTTITSSADDNCAAEWEQCGGEGTEAKCCEAGTQCYKDSKWYSQCRQSCPAGWECNDSTSISTTATSATTTSAAVTTTTTTTSSADGNCAAEWAQCGGEGAEAKCCEAGTQCYKDTKWYSQCRQSCPAGWECNDVRRYLRGSA